ncbi:kelch-like protein 18 [Acropora palmata]|uniref:kelch-like protein 18 n=1 Tax=Acropora palmata TaxID=6131 RepID=UPI003DA070D2
MDFDSVSPDPSVQQLDNETFKFEAGSKHGIKALMVMDDLRKRRQLCDVTICVGSKKIYAHRLVLSSFSSYFLAMFTNGMMESVEETITLKDVDGNVVELLIDFAYSGKLDITIDTVQSLLYTSSLFQLTAIQKACSDFLQRQLHPSNCLGIRSFAGTHSCTVLLQASEKFIHEHFNDVVQNEEFLLLPREELATLLSCEEINVDSEEDVYNALIAWARQDVDERQSFLAELLEQIRLPTLSPHFLVDEVEKEELIRQDIACRNLLDEAKNFHMLPDRRSKLGSQKSRPRKSTFSKLFSVCGMDSTGHPLRTVEQYNFHSGKVKYIPPLNTPRSGLGVAVLDGKLYAVGGHDGTSYLNSVECYNLTTGEWKFVAPMNQPRRYVAATALGGLLYAVGGYDGVSVLDSVEVYNPKLDQWKRVGSMSNARRHVAVGVLENKDGDSSGSGYLYAVGGHDGIIYLKTVERYDPVTNEWTCVASMGARRGGVGVAALGGCLYATGGYDGSSNLSTSERYYPDEDRWAFVAPMSVCRSGHGVGVVNGCLYALGGHDGVSYRNRVEFFDPQVGEWKTVGQMGLCKAVAGVAVLKEN